MRPLALLVTLLASLSCGVTDGCREMRETAYVGYDDNGRYVDGVAALMEAHPAASCEPNGSTGHLAVYTCHWCG